MRKTQFLAVFWTLILAIPITALALTATAYLTDNLTQISTMIALTLGDTLAKARDLVFEAELIGLIAGQAVILTILLVTYLTRPKEETTNS
jgi:hypothetical protein